MCDAKGLRSTIAPRASASRGQIVNIC